MKDIIYLDTVRSSSLLSQLDEGLSSEFTISEESGSDYSGRVGLSIPFVKAEGKAGESAKHRRTTTKIYHHDVVNRIELELSKKNLITKLPGDFEKFNGSFNEYRASFGSKQFVKVTGFSEFLDLDRMNRVFRNFNQISEYIHTPRMLEIPEIKELMEALEKAEIELVSVSSNKRSAVQNRVGSLKAKLNLMKKASLGDGHVSQWLIDSVGKITSTLSPDRFNFRMFPLEVFDDFSINANLKKEYLINSNVDQLYYTYGTRPTMKITLLGVVSMVPMKEDKRVVPLEELFYDKEGDEDHYEGKEFNLAFRNLVRKFEFLDKMMLNVAYPSVTVAPIAIYRDLDV